MQLVLSKNAEREYLRIPKYEQRKVKKKLTSLELSPFSGKKLGGELGVYHSIRAWPYRVIYKIDKDHKIIFVEKIQHRQGAYK